MKPLLIITIIATAICRITALPLSPGEPLIATGEEWSEVFEEAFGYCGAPGNTCYSAELAADAVIEALAGSEEDIKPYAPSLGFCGAAGNNCRKKRASLNRVGAAAENTYKVIKAREAAAQVNAREWDLTPWKIDTFILKAPDAFAEVKQSEQAASFTTSSTKEALQVEKECHGPEGACTVARQALEELEAAINDAVASLDE